MLRTQLSSNFGTTAPLQSKHELRILKNNLEEHIRKLACLASIAELAVVHDLTVKEILKRAVEFIPQGWQDPETVCARIAYSNHSYSTHNFRKTKWKVSSCITIKGIDVGHVEVFYLKKTGPSSENPFPQDKRELIHSMCAQMGIIIGNKITEQELHNKEAELNHCKKELRGMADRLQSLREVERKRLAHKVHDELGQVLTVLNMDLSLLSKELTEDQKEIFTLIKEMKRTISQASRTIQKISVELRPRLIDELGLIPSIKWQLKEFQKHTGIKCTLVLDNKSINPDLKISIAVFRIIQEALTNIARHAEATEVTVRLSAKPTGLIINIKDNGKGISESRISNITSFGILGIRESVLSLGGKLGIKGIPNKGTTVNVSFPLNNRI